MRLKTNKSFFILIIFIFLQLTGTCQILPKLSKDKMLEDYNFLLNIISKYNPQLEIREQVQKINIIDSIANYKGKITNCGNTKEFVLALNEILNLCNDSHFSFEPYIDDSLKKREIKINSKYYKVIRSEQIHSSFAPNIFYKNDTFYVLQGLGLRKTNKIDTIVYPGTKILSINNIPTSLYIKKHLQLRNDYKWDLINHKFYSEIISFNKEMGIAPRLLLNFDGNDYTLNYKVNLFNRQTIWGYWDLKFLEKQVIYFEKNRILYIRMPEMDNKEYYVNEILNKGNGKQIDKVVIDIRDNPGGDDEVWMSVLSVIIKNPLITNLEYGIPNVPELLKALDVSPDSLTTAPQPFLNNRFLLYNESEVIKPFENSLKYDGKIYILQNQNCYSAAGSLIAMAEYHDNIINIGQETGVILGRGMTPIIFMLPNSKFNFRIHPVIDLTNVKTPIDVFHDKIKIFVDVSIAQFIQFYHGDYVFGEEFLLNNDPWFKKVIEN